MLAPPRSEACCILGEKFFKEGDFNTAKYWYNAALNCDNNVGGGGFFNADYCGFVPLMQLCVIYDRLGDFKRANAFNEAAGKIKPHNENFLINKKYFRERIGKEET